MAVNPFLFTIVTRRLKFLEENSAQENGEDDDDMFDFSTLKDSIQITKSKKRKEYTNEDPLMNSHSGFGNLRDSVTLAKMQAKKRVKIDENKNKVKLIPNLQAIRNQTAFHQEKEIVVTSPSVSPSKPILKKQSSYEEVKTETQLETKAASKPVSKPVKTPTVDNSAAPELPKKLPMFHNMTFGITGHVNREELEKCIAKGGGKVTGVVGKKVTYLVCDKGAYKDDTQRVRKAKKFGTVIVTPDFVYESAYSNSLQPAAKYTLYDGKPIDKEDDSYL